MLNVSSEFVISMAEKAVYVTLMISGPLLAIALLVGLIVSIFQATTQSRNRLWRLFRNRGGSPGSHFFWSVDAVDDSFIYNRAVF